MTVYEKIKARLDENGMAYVTQHHEPTVTSEDAARVRGVSMHAGAKAIVVRGNKTGNHFLFVMPADLRLDGVKVKGIIGERMSFAPDPEAVTGCVRGSVPPFGSVVGLKTYCDLRLAENADIHFNAGSLTDSITMKYEDYVRAERPEIVDIAGVADPEHA